MSVYGKQDFSHYQILEKLGQGGMGIVYKAYDTNLKRNVALKFLPENLTMDESARKRFMVEAQAASALDHPNICTIHEIANTDDGQLYICMAYYEGQSLSDRIKKGTIPFDEATKIIAQIATGLQEAHFKDITHRDIKPGNIILTENGDVKIVDFGLAKLAGIDLTQSTSSKGTSAYMCPEQIRGEKVDKRCDIWAMGVVFFEMLTGKLPFRGEYAEPLMFSIVNEQPATLSQYLSNTPDKLQQIIDKLLIKNPAERYQTLSEFFTAMDPFLEIRDLPTIQPISGLTKLFQKKKTYIYATIVLVLVVLWAVFKPRLVTQDSQSNNIAVLPMKNFSNNAEQELTESITDALISKLAQISSLNVTSLTSVLRYKESEKSLPEIARELDVDYLVESSVTKMVDNIKISARLINAANDKALWAKDFEREIIHILALQSEIARTIVNEMKINLTPQEEKLLTESRTIDPQVFILYTRGVFHLNKRTPEGLKKGISLLNKAVELDPNEPLAWASLSLGYSMMAHTAAPTEGAAENCKEAALKALELDDNLAEAHLAMAMYNIYSEWDREAAEFNYKRALQLDPTSDIATYHWGWFLVLKRKPSEGMKYLKRAQLLDPNSAVYPAELAFAAYLNWDYDLAISESKKALDLSPEDPFALFTLGAGYSGKNMFEEAIAVQKRSAELSPYWSWGLARTYAKAGMIEECFKIINKLESEPSIWDTWCLATIYEVLGDADKMFFWLNEAYIKRHPYIPWLQANNALFGKFKDDPRYKDLLKRLYHEI